MSFISSIYIVFEKKGLFLQENKDIFVKIEPNFDEGSYFKFWIFNFKRSFIKSPYKIKPKDLVP